MLAPLGTAARAKDPVVEEDLDLDGGVAAGVEDLACADSFDGCHGVLLGRGRGANATLVAPGAQLREAHPVVGDLPDSCG